MQPPAALALHVGGMRPACRRSTAAQKVPARSAAAHPHCRVFLQVITVLSAWWLLAKFRTSLYLTHRVPLVLLLKVVLAMGVLHITNDSPRLFWIPHQVAPSTALLAFQTAMTGGVMHLPALCVGLVLPFRMQLAWALWRSAIFVLGFCGRGGWCRVHLRGIRAQFLAQHMLGGLLHGVSTRGPCSHAAVQSCVKFVTLDSHCCCLCCRCACCPLPQSW
jgi:hypothetical protein